MKLYDPLLEKVKTFMSSVDQPPVINKKPVSVKIKNSEGFIFFTIKNNKEDFKKLSAFVANKAFSVRDTLNSKFTIPARDKEWTVIIDGKETVKGAPIDIFEFLKSIQHMLHEAVYEGNIGLVELVQFYKIATKEQKTNLEKLIAQRKFKEGWAYFQEIIGVSLKQ
jgi:hypothetical protein